jgi:outer membrane lipase/esterase
MSRLDGAQEQAAVDGGSSGGPMGLGMKSKAPRSQPVAPSSPVSVYAMGTFAGGHRSDTPDSVGLTYEATAGTVGMEYRVTRNLIVGLAGNITTASADLHNGADVGIDAVQLAMYISYATKLWFVDGLLSYGRYDLDTTRPGLSSLVHGNTGGDVFALAVRGGYLFDLGGVRAGPIAGLSFARTRVDGYTETGDQQVAMHIASQSVDAVIGNVGVRFLAPFLADGKVVIPYLNITLEQQLGGDAHAINVSLAQAGTEPILVSAPNFETRTYGKIEGGVTLHLGPNFSATVSGASTFARDEGNDYRLSTGLTYKF